MPTSRATVTADLTSELRCRLDREPTFRAGGGRVGVIPSTRLKVPPFPSAGADVTVDAVCPDIKRPARPAPIIVCRYLVLKEVTTHDPAWSTDCIIDESLSEFWGWRDGWDWQVAGGGDPSLGRRAEEVF